MQTLPLLLYLRERDVDDDVRHPKWPCWQRQDITLVTHCVCQHDHTLQRHVYCLVHRSDALRCSHFCWAPGLEGQLADARGRVSGRTKSAQCVEVVCHSRQQFPCLLCHDCSCGRRGIYGELTLAHRQQLQAASAKGVQLLQMCALLRCRVRHLALRTLTCRAGERVCGQLAHTRSIMQAAHAHSRRLPCACARSI